MVVRKLFKGSLLATGAALAFSTPVRAAAQESHVSLPAQPLGSALRAVAQPTGTNILFVPEAVRGVRSPGLSGKYTPREAVEELLRDTNLFSTVNSDGTIVVRPKSSTSGDKSSFQRRHAAALTTAMASATMMSQETEAAPPPAAAPEPVSETFVPEDIVVTAQRREQSLQDVPISVSAVGRAELETHNIESVAEIRTLVPSLTMTVQGGNVIQPFLRGVGNPAVALGNEASTAIYVDGVYIARLPKPLFDLNNVERVEVLRGPQGTLFGRNSTGGLIQVVTRDPSSQESSLNVSAGYGNYDTFRGSLYASTPISDTLAADISVTGQHQSDGWGRNIDTGADAFFTRDIALRSKWMYRGERTTITLAGDYVDSHYNNTGFTSRSFDGSGSRHRSQVAPFDIVPQGGFYDVSGETEQTGRIEFYGGSLKIVQDLDFADLVSISAANYLDGYNQFDADFTLTPFFYTTQPQSVRQVSQELQLVSAANSSFDWILGLYYLNLRSRYTDLVLGGIAVGGAADANAVVNSTATTNSYSAYAQGTFHVFENTDLTLGGRYTKDDLNARGTTDFVIPSFDVNVPGMLIEAGTSFKKLTFRAALDHEFAHNNHVYISQSRGFKSGIYNLLPFSTLPADSETIDTTEIGLKLVTLGGRARFNIAGFYNWIDSPQVNIYPDDGTPSIQIINAGSAVSRGIEFDGSFAPTERLSFTFGAAYVDAHYTDFENAPFYFRGQYPATGGPADPQPGDATGNRLPQAPRLTANLGFSYAVPTSVGELTFSGNYYRASAYYFHPDNYLRQPSYNLFDAQVRLTLPDDRWAVRLWGRNLGGERYYTGADQQGGLPGHSAGPGAPRTYGLTLEYNLN